MNIWKTRRKASFLKALVPLLAVLAAWEHVTPVAAGELDIERILSAVVKIKAEVPAEARTARFLGTEREGSGVVIDDDGLILTVGYLILESTGAEITAANGRTVQGAFVAYDHDTGFGLLRASKPLGVKPLQLGNSSPLGEREPVLIVANGGPQAAMGAFVVSRRDFAGSWEYLLENAIFTAPPHGGFGGAALVDKTGRLIGIGSLIVANAADGDDVVPGNMFLPIDALKPIFGDLLANGRSSAGRRPWLGLYSEEHRGRLFVTRVPPNGPAYRAGVRPGDMVLSVGGKSVRGLADFYRKVWSLGKAGVSVPLTILRDSGPEGITVKSIDRYDWLKMKMSY